MGLSDDPVTPSEPVRAAGPTLLAVGIDHRSAPLELRERVALSPEQTEGLLLRLMARPEVAEAYVLSTCNRTEIYLHPHPVAPSSRWCSASPRSSARCGGRRSSPIPSAAPARW
jgi:glutamyl-tRNA reductase